MLAEEAGNEDQQVVVNTTSRAFNFRIPNDDSQTLETKNLLLGEDALPKVRNLQAGTKTQKLEAVPATVIPPVNVFSQVATGGKAFGNSLTALSCGWREAANTKLTLASKPLQPKDGKRGKGCGPVALSSPPL